MLIEKVGEKHISATFAGYEVESIGVGFVIHEHLEPDDEVYALLGALTCEGRDIWSHPKIFTLNSKRGIERELLKSIVKIGSNAAGIMVEAFADEVAGSDVSTAFDRIHKARLSEHLEVLEEMSVDLQLAGLPAH